MPLKLTELRRRPRPEQKEAPLRGAAKTRTVTKRRRRRNGKLRDRLKRAGRHRGFSHGKA